MEDKWRLDYAMILVEVKSLKDIKVFTPIKVNGKDFIVQAFLQVIVRCEAKARRAKFYSNSSNDKQFHSGPSTTRKEEEEVHAKGTSYEAVYHIFEKLSEKE